MLAFVGLAICLIIAVFTIHNLIKRPNTNDIGTKVVSHSVGIAIFTVAGGLIMAVLSCIGLFGLFGNIEPDGWITLLGPLLMGLLISGFMVPSLSSRHDIYWDEETIEGPNKLFGPSLSGTRIKLNWKDIVSNGAVATGYSYVEASSGHRVYYSPYSKGLRPLKKKISSIMRGE